MKRMALVLSISLCLICLICGCKNTPCIKGSLSFGLISFTDQESDSVIIRRFTKTGNFNAIIDSSVCLIGYNRNNDTLNRANATGNADLESSFDYELYFPGASKLYKISEIMENKKEIKHAIFSNVKVGCENTIISLRVNGQLIYPQRLNYFYIRK